MLQALFCYFFAHHLLNQNSLLIFPFKNPENGKANFYYVTLAV